MTTTTKAAHTPDGPSDAEARGRLEAQIGHRFSDCPYSGPRLRAAWRKGFAAIAKATGAA